MPKKLDNIRPKAIAHTRAVLEQEGFARLNMRDIAKKCEVAVGTMYNYFPSKEYLTGCVVLEDWLVTYEQMTAAAANADTIGHGFGAVYELMLQFVMDHQYLTDFNSVESKTSFDFEERHQVLLKQMEDLVSMLQQRFGYSLEAPVCTFLAESVLSFSVKKYPYMQIAPAFMKLLR